MRLLKKLSHPDGSVEVKVSVGTSEDLWHLYNLIVPGDCVRTKTKRKVVKEGSLGSAGVEMRMLLLTLQVKQIHFTPDEVRIQGTNVSENEFVKLGAHHSLTVHAFPPQEVSIVKKEWDPVADERLRESCNQECKADTVALLMSFGEASVLLVTPSFIYTKSRVEVSISKKHKNDGTARDKSITKFYKQVLDAFVAHVDFARVKLVLICSPGNVRDEFLRYIKEQCQRADHGPLRELQLNLPKIMLMKVHSTTISALREVFSDPAVAHRMESTRCASDIQVWDRFQVMMNNDPDRCVYTPQFVYHAAMAGAVATLMVSDTVFRSASPVERRFYLTLMQFVKQGGGQTWVFSSHHVTGEQLTQLGNVAAVLHFACPELDEIEIREDFLLGEEVTSFIRENAVTKVTV